MLINPQSRNIDFKKGTVLLVDKPLNWTSFDVVNKLRYAIKPFTGKIKVGHAGTLDPKATGLLIVCTGKFTKQIDSIVAQEKEYTGTFIFGATTPSFDTEKEVDQTFKFDHITTEGLVETTKMFSGHIEQLPPIYSAIKKDGEALYLKARRGEAVEIKARPVFIKRFEITDVALPVVSFSVACGKGTYIRSLANDYGKAMQSGAYLGTLVRTRIGDFPLENAWQLDELINFIKDNACQTKTNEGLQKSE